MARPYLDILGQTEQSFRRCVEVFCAAAWEVAARGADVCVEDGVAAEDVFWSFYFSTVIAF